jgi:lipid-binding SYLF domain-containing protein
MKIFSMKTGLRVASLALLICTFFVPAAGAMSSTPELERAAGAALSKLYARNSKAAEIGRRSVAVLVFPDAHMVAAGVGVQTATGVLFYKNQSMAYFNLTGISGGLELGIRKFDYAIFLENDEAVDKLYQVGGFEIGVAPTLVIGDGLISGRVSSLSLRSGVDVFVSSQRGLMISLGFGKAKITEYVPDN